MLDERRPAISDAPPRRPFVRAGDGRHARIRRIVTLGAMLALSALSLAACRSGAEVEAERLAEVMRQLPGASEVESTHRDGPVGYASSITIRVRLEVVDELPDVLEAWSDASPDSTASLLVEAGSERCILTTDRPRASGIEQTSRFLRSLCAEFPQSDVWIALNDGDEGPDGRRFHALHLDAGGDGAEHADAALAARISALPGADAPISAWFLRGSADPDERDYAPTNPGPGPEPEGHAR